MTANIERDIGRIEGKLDQILANQEGFAERHNKLDEKLTEKHESLATRITGVENKLHWYTGGLAAISATFVFAGEQIKRVFFGH